MPIADGHSGTFDSPEVYQTDLASFRSLTKQNQLPSAIEKTFREIVQKRIQIVEISTT